MYGLIEWMLPQGHISIKPKISQKLTDILYNLAITLFFPFSVFSAGILFGILTTNVTKFQCFSKMTEVKEIQTTFYFPEKRYFKYDSWYSISFSLLLWASIYQVLRYLLKSKNQEYCCRILSFGHGLISAFIGINQCFIIDEPFSHPEWRTTSSQRFLLVFSLGYFLHDLVWCLLYDRSSKLMIAHHIYSAIALYRTLYKEKSGAQATCALGSMEITNPMLQVRWFLRSEGFYPSILYTSVELTFMMMFVLVRIVLGTYFLFVIVFQPKNDWDFRMLSLIIYIMSWMFMVNIFKYVRKKYTRQEDDATNKSS